MSGQTLIHGDRFAALADVVYASRSHGPLEDRVLRRRVAAARTFGEPVVIYSDTEHANRLNDALRRVAGIAQVVLITHNGDAKVSRNDLRDIDADYSRRAASVSHWYAQNVDVVDADLSPLPIGLERPHWYPKLKKEGQILARRARPNTRERLLYVNHNVANNPIIREIPYRLFEGEPYALVRRGRNGVDFPRYIEDLATSAFCISPPGNGLDCHRTWEALYLGCVPIVLRSVLAEHLYDGLPVMVVDDYRELNDKVLLESMPRFPAESFEIDRLYMEHYESAIRARCAELGRTTPLARGRRRRRVQRWTARGAGR